MRSFLSPAALLVVSLTGGAAHSQSSEALPVYPIWNHAQMPDGPAAMADRMPMPMASAVPVAVGYLLTSAEAMDKMVFRLDLRDSDAVYIFDGKDWHSGRYVDFDSRYGLALIRADVPGTPVGLATKHQGLARFIGIPWANAMDRPIVRADHPLRECDQQPDFFGELLGQRQPATKHCFQGRVKTLAGGALINFERRLVGLQVNSFGSQEHAIVGAAEIRNFIQGYFASWGSGIKDKPKL